MQGNQFLFFRSSRCPLRCLGSLLLNCRFLWLIFPLYCEDSSLLEIVKTCKNGVCILPLDNGKRAYSLKGTSIFSFDISAIFSRIPPMKSSLYFTVYLLSSLRVLSFFTSHLAFFSVGEVVAMIISFGCQIYRFLGDIWSLEGLH